MMIVMSYPEDPIVPDSSYPAHIVNKFDLTPLFPSHIDLSNANNYIKNVVILRWHYVYPVIYSVFCLRLGQQPIHAPWVFFLQCFC